LPEDIEVGDKQAEIIAEKEGRVLWINNRNLAQVAREAGAPKDRGAGIILKVKLGKRVKKGDALFEIYAERTTKLNAAIKLAEKLQPIGLSKKLEERMLIDRIPKTIMHKKVFTLER
jgi:AMP phosphorylase